MEQGRLRVDDPGDGSSMGVRDLLGFCARRSEGFETAYLVYRDLRARGRVARQRDGDGFDLYKEGAHPRRQNPSTLVLPRAASAETTPAELDGLMGQARSLGRRALLSVVDEESDVTHYEVAQATVSGQVDDPAPQRAAQARALLLGDRAILLEDAGLREAGYGKEAGDEVFCSLPEIHHLVEHGLDLVDPDGQPASPSAVRERANRQSRHGELALDAYRWLRDRSLVPKAGFKYGVNFRVYRTPVDQGHAPFLVQTAPADEPWTFQELARLSRLAHGVKKRPILWSPAGTLTMTWTKP